MKKFLTVIAIMLAGCAGENEHGECVGFGKQSPEKTYELSTRNAVVAAIFFQSFWVPVAWALEYAYCPTGENQAAAK
jgi:ABC-type uncharacterized transport system auxiliary subunit